MCMCEFTKILRVLYLFWNGYVEYICIWSHCASSEILEKSINPVPHAGPDI